MAIRRIPVLVAAAGLLISIACNLSTQPVSVIPTTETITTTPAITISPTITPTVASTAVRSASPDLTLDISLKSPVEPPESIAITITMTDPDAAYCDWMLGDVAGEITSGRLSQGEAVMVELVVDWPTSPFLSSNRLLYVYGKGDDGSTFAQVVEVPLYNPFTLTPTITMSCGYTLFEVTTPTELNVEHPSSSFDVSITNKGLFQCGDTEWQVVTPSPQADSLTCSPSGGILEGSESYDKVSAQTIQCTVNWDNIAPGQTQNLFLVIFSYPRVNGTDSAHLVTVRATKP